MNILRTLCLVIAVSSACLAQRTEPNLAFAFEQLNANGTAPFAKAMYETDLSAARVFGSQLEMAAKGAGAYMDYEIMSRKPLSRRVERLVIAIYFEKYPVYMRVDFYDSVRGKVCLPALISKEAKEVLPLDIMSAVGP